MESYRRRNDYRSRCFGWGICPHEIIKGAVKAAQDFKIGIALVGKKEILHVQARRYMKDLDITIVDAPEYIDDAESRLKR